MRHGTPGNLLVDVATRVASPFRWSPVHRLTVTGDVPVDGFWSVSVYGADGYFHKNDQNAYSINNVTAKKAADGSVTIQFGGCDGKTTNCIPITPGWN